MTRPEIRGRLEPTPRVFCRFCPEKFRNFDDLRFHAQAEHKRDFYRVNRELAKIDAKLRSLEQLAAEGMRGYQDAPVGATIHGYIETPIDEAA